MIHIAMILSYKDRRTKQLAGGQTPKGVPPDVVKQSRAMLTALNAADQLNDLRFPPGNRLEKLTGNRKEQHSVRVNRQWRICFRWTERGPEQVEFTDYH